MPLRLACAPVSVTPGGLLHSYWGPRGFHRARIDVFAVGARGVVGWTAAQVDNASDFVVLESRLARLLGLTLPFPSQEGVSGAAGTQAATFSFPPDGLVSLFVT